MVAVILLSYLPALQNRAQAATLEVPTINIITTDLGGENGLPLYRYAIENKPNLTIKLKLNLVSPQKIQQGDTLDAPWYILKNPDIKGVFLGLKGDPTNQGCESGITDYVGCTYDFGDLNADKGFRVIMPMTAGTDENYTVTLTYDDLVKLGIPTAAANIPDTGKLKDVYFEPNILYTELGIKNGHVSLYTGFLTVRIYVFKTEQQKQTATNLTTGGLHRSSFGSRTAPLDNKSGLGGLLLSIVNIILGVIISLLRWLIYALANIVFLPLLEKTLTFTAGGIAGGAILIGWTYVRDIVNMLFILVLIAIGLGTILRIESYNYKKLLVNVIMMALLVNFSLLIGQIIIQLADVVQFTFLPADQGITGVRDLYEKLFTVNTFGIVAQGITFDTAAALNATFTMIFQFVLELGVIITFGALAIFMLIRTVALWILLIISPIAYALAVLPATAGLAKKWWTNFIKYAFFAPLIAFFLRLSFTIYEHALQFGSFSGQATADAGTTALLSKVASGGGGFTQSLELSMTYVVIIAFLWAGLVMTRQMGIFGANAIVGLAEKGMKAPFALAGSGVKRGVGFAGQKWNEWTSKLIKEKAGFGRKAAFAVLNPVGFFRGWGLRAKERKEQAQHIAAGAGQEVATSMWTRGKEKLPYKEMAKRRIQREFVKKLQEAMGEDIDKAEAKDMLERVKDVGGLEGEMLRGGVSLITTKHGYNDDTSEILLTELADKLNIPKDDKIRNRYNDVSDQYADWAFIELDVDVLTKLRTDKDYKMSKEFKNWVKKDDNQTKLRTLFEQTKMAFDVGHYEQGYKAVKDSDGMMYGQEMKGYYVPVVNEEFAGGNQYRTEAIMGEVVKVPIRTFWQKGTWHNLKPKVYKLNQKTGKKEWMVGDFVDEENGESMLTGYQKKFVESIGPEKIDQMTHAQARQILYLIGDYIDQYGNVTNAVQFEAFRKLNPVLAEAMRNVRVYGRPRATDKDKAEMEATRQTIETDRIITGNKLDARYRPTIDKVYTEYQAGRMDTAAATMELSNAGMGAVANDIMKEIKSAMAEVNSGKAVATSYVPPDAYEKLQSAKLVQKYVEAVKKGMNEGFKIGPQMKTVANKSALELRIRTQIQPILTDPQVGLSAADVQSIARALALQFNS